MARYPGPPLGAVQYGFIPSAVDWRNDTGSSSLFLCSLPVLFSVIRAVPGVRFQEVRTLVSMAQVLELVGFIGHERSCDEVRGPCPVHGSRSPKSRSFTANLKRNVYHCFRCGSAGNHLDLYATATHQSLFAAAIDLCARVGCAVPWIKAR